MAGFDNDTMYAANVDFRGVKPVVGQVTTDGQLLIGSTAAPHIKVGSLTSTDTSLTYTTGSGTLDSAISSAYLRVGVVPVTAAQMKNLSTVAVTLVPAAGAGTLIQVDSITSILDFATTPYANTSLLRVCYTDVTTLIDSLSFTNILTATEDYVDYQPLTEFDGTAAVAVDKPVVILNSSTDYTNGDSPITFRIVYRIHPTGL